MKKFKGYTPKMLRELGADEDKPIIIVCGGCRFILEHAYVADKESEPNLPRSKYGTLVIDMDV